MEKPKCGYTAPGGAVCRLEAGHGCPHFLAPLPDDVAERSFRVLHAAERAIDVAGDESNNANETLAALALANAAACHTAGMTENEAVQHFRIAFNSPPRKDAPPEPTTVIEGEAKGTK